MVWLGGGVVVCKSSTGSLRCQLMELLDFVKKLKSQENGLKLLHPVRAPLNYIELSLQKLTELIAKLPNHLNR